MSLFEYIPPALRRGSTDAGAVITLASAALAQEVGDDPDLINAAAELVQGMEQHILFLGDADQEMAKGVRDIGWKFFRETIEDVEVFERRSKDGKFLVGKKARIHFPSDGDDENFIDTEWIEHNGFHYPELTFEMALARSIEKDARSVIGGEALIIKHVYPIEMANGKPGKSRSIANIIPLGNTNSSKSAPKSRSQNRDEPDPNELRKVVKSFDREYDTDLRKMMRDSDYGFLAENIDASRKDFAAELSDYLDQDVDPKSHDLSYADKADKNLALFFEVLVSDEE